MDSQQAPTDVVTALHSRSLASFSCFVSESLEQVRAINQCAAATLDAGAKQAQKFQVSCQLVEEFLQDSYGHQLAKFDDPRIPLDIAQDMTTLRNGVATLLAQVERQRKTRELIQEKLLQLSRLMMEACDHLETHALDVEQSAATCAALSQTHLAMMSRAAKLNPPTDR